MNGAMKKSLGYILMFTLVHNNLIQCGPSMNDTKTLVTDLLNDYQTYVRPVVDQHGAVNVYLQLYMKSIQEFDEVSEKFSFVGALSIAWIDPSLTWTPSDYGGLTEIIIPADSVWVPELILSSAATSRNTIKQSWNTVRIFADGNVIWVPASLVESTCAVNVRNYPFDTQICGTSFYSLGYKNVEVTLVPAVQTINFDILQPNALWDITGSDVAVEVISGGESEIYFHTHLKRKSAYVVVNVLLPIMFLSLLNAAVFVLVPESGERIGYCITALLAIAVYMTIIADMLPQSSEPVPIISYKLMTDMVVSASIVLVTILNMRLHNRDDEDEVPGCVVSLYKLFTCYTCRRRKVNPFNIGQDSDKPTNKIKTVFVNEKIAFKEDVEDGHLHTKDDMSECFKPPTYKEVSKMCDWIALVSFTMISLTSFAVFVCLTSLTD